MNKTLPVLLVAAKDEAARLAELATKATVALTDGLMAFCCSVGLAVVAQLMEAEHTYRQDRSKGPP